MYEELIKRLREIHPEAFDNQWDFAYACQQVMHEAANAIEELTDRNVGKWIPVKEETGVEAFGFKEMTVVVFRCSACGKEVDVSEGDFNFCPFCGAKMEG